MKIPKYIDKALIKRTRYANLLNKYCCIVDEWILRNKLDDKIDSSCYLTGVEIYVNPDSAEEAVRRAALMK